MWTLVTLRGHKQQVTSVALSPDGKNLATGSEDRTVKLWGVTTSQDPATLGDHANLLTSVAFSSDGKKLATASLDGMKVAKDSLEATVKLWDVAGRQELITLQSHERPKPDAVFPAHIVAFSPDGKRLATGHVDGTAKLWDVVTGHEVTSSPLLQDMQTRSFVWRIRQRARGWLRQVVTKR